MHILVEANEKIYLQPLNSYNREGIIHALETLVDYTGDEAIWEGDFYTFRHVYGNSVAFGPYYCKFYKPAPVTVVGGR